MSDQVMNQTESGGYSHPAVKDFQHHTELPTTRISDVLDGIIQHIGAFFSWFWLANMGVILFTVIWRYVFGQGSIMLEEISWHIYAVVWSLGMSYALVSDHHVRVDVLHENFSLRTQAWIEVLGILVLLMPFLIITIYYAFPYFWHSFERGEVSQAPSGLGARWALKFVMPAAFCLLVIAGFSRLLKCTALLFGRPRPIKAGAG